MSEEEIQRAKDALVKMREKDPLGLRLRISAGNLLEALRTRIDRKKSAGFLLNWKQEARKIG